jgi:LmbE family N-acetylglucosaminyl deacetylase
VIKIERNPKTLITFREKILIFEPHPDDIAYQISGSVFKWLNEEKEIFICTVTKGNNSTFNLHVSSEQIEKIMMEEHHNAMKFLEIPEDHQIQWKYDDLGIDPALDRQKLLFDMILLIRQVRPTTVITMDPKNIPLEENPDHRAVASVGFEATAMAAYPNVMRDQFEKYQVSPHFTARILFYMTPDPNVFVDISGDPFDKKKVLGTFYPSQLELMITEADARLRTLGLDPELKEVPNKDLWEAVCESSANEHAQEGMQFYKTHPHLAPRVPLQYAEAFRLCYLGSVEKLRDLLPKSLLTF